MDESPRGFLDATVESLCAIAERIGLPGARWSWRWRNFRRRVAEQREQTANHLRSVRVEHKMCPHCRALVPRNAVSCPQCGDAMTGVSTPGAGRLFSNLLPGGASAVSLLALLIGVVFLLTLMWSIRLGEGGGLLGLDWRALALFGATWRERVLGFDQWWTLVTAMFLHGGLIHIGFNTLALIRLGPFVESEVGGTRLWTIFFSCGLVGNAVHIALSPSPVVGASGGLLGLVGFLFAYSGRFKTRGARFVRARMVEILIFMVLISLLPIISWQAHLGGTLAGMVFGALLPKGEARNRPDSVPWNLAAWACMIVVLVAFLQVARNA